jgi:hypothetical protein
MDELLSTFLDTYFSDELKEQIMTSFDLFDFYEYRQAYSGLMDIMNEHSNVSSDNLQDRFIQEVHSKLNYMLEQHTIKLIDDATLSQKNQILTSLAHLQKLQDYTGVIRTLETFADDYEQLAIIISDSTLMDQSEVQSLIESFNPSILQTLKQFIYQKEQEFKQTDEPNIKLMQNLKLFDKFSEGKGISSAFVKNGSLVGDRFSTYLKFIEHADLVGTDDDAAALNILSLLYMSIDGVNSPLLVFRKYSFHILRDLNIVSRVESKLLDYIGKFTEFKKAHHESLRLLETGTTA